METGRERERERESEREDAVMRETHKQRGKIKIQPTTLWLTWACSPLDLFGNVLETECAHRLR